MAKTKKELFLGINNISGASITFPTNILKNLIKDKFYTCPRCGYPVNKNQCRCPNCGQPIKWH